MQNIYLSQHFKLSEFEASRKAEEHGIANIAPPEAVENLRRLCKFTLEPLREEIGLPVIITSGYRTKKLNDMLAHSTVRSQHMAGQAADFYIGEISAQASNEAGVNARQRLIKAFRLILTCERIDYDQLILYPNFIHVSYVSKERNRHNILLARSDGKLGYGKLSYTNALKIQ